MSNAKNEEEKYKLTFEELKNYPGFNSIDITEAEEVINNLHLLSLLLYEFYQSTIDE